MKYKPTLSTRVFLIKFLFIHRRPPISNRITIVLYHTYRYNISLWYKRVFYYSILSLVQLSCLFYMCEGTKLPINIPRIYLSQCWLCLKNKYSLKQGTNSICFKYLNLFRARFGERRTEMSMNISLERVILTIITITKQNTTKLNHVLWDLLLSGSWYKKIVIFPAVKPKTPLLVNQRL